MPDDAGTACPSAPQRPRLISESEPPTSETPGTQAPSTTPSDALAGLSGARGGDEGFALGLGSKGGALGPSFLADSFDLLDLTVGVAYDVAPDFNVHLSYLSDLAGANAGKGHAWQIGVTAKY